MKGSTHSSFLIPAILTMFIAAAFQPAANTTQTTSELALASPHYQADFTPIISNGYHEVSWDKGRLVSFGASEMKEPVALYDKRGNWLFATFPAFEGALHVYGQDAVPTKSGTVILAASATTSDGTVADIIAEVGKSGVMRVIRTTHFYVDRVCATDDGTVWAYGQELTEDRKGESAKDYPVLREYSFDRGQLRTVLQRGTVHPPAGTPLSGARRDVFLKCGAKKLVVVNGATNELMEYDFASSTLSRWPIASFGEGFYMTGAALTQSGDVYVSVLRPSPKTLSGVLRLNVTSAGIAKWTSLETRPAAGNYVILLGNDGDDLVYSRGRRAPTLFWSKAPGTEVTK
jgi:hypothetical protein